MKLVHGTREDHIATAERAKSNNIRSIWTGDIARNEYLQENLDFIQMEGLATVTFEDNVAAQQSNYIIHWM